MGLNTLDKAGNKAAPFVSALKAFNSFINVNGTSYDDLITLAGVADFRDLTDNQIEAYFGITPTASEMVEIRAGLYALEDIIIDGRVLQSAIPANDIT
jgi:hypothetical protein